MKPQANKPSEGLIKAAGLVFLAMTYEETIRPQIEAIQQKLINFWKFEPAPMWKERTAEGQPTTITQWKHAYLIDDADAKILYDEYDIEIKKAGYTVKPRYCPLLIAEDNTRTAKKLLIEEAQYITGLTVEQATRSMKSYKQLVDITLKYCAPFVDSKKLLKEIVQ